MLIIKVAEKESASTSELGSVERQSAISFEKTDPQMFESRCRSKTNF